MRGETWKILIVDDSPEDRAEMRRVLLIGSERRFRFAEAATGGDVLRAYPEGWEAPPDCILLDYHLPDYDAPELLAALGGPDSPRCPVVVVTGTAGLVDSRTILRRGAQDFIGKGWMNPESLTRTIENAIERFRLDRELKASQARLRSFLDNSVTVAWMKDSEGRYVYLSRAFEQRFDACFEDWRGKTDFDVFPPGQAERLRENDLAVLAHGRFVEFTEEVSNPDGSLSWWLCTKFPFVDAAGQLFVGGLAVDITARKRAEEKLHEADQRKDEFLAMLAHELRNPLASIRNAARILDRADSNPAKLAWCREVIDRQSGHLARLVDDLLDISRITRGKIELRKERLDLVDIVRWAVETSRPLIDAHGHGLSVRLPPEPLPVHGDPVRLSQVVSNLLNNAAKYTEEGGHIRLTARREGGEALVSVRDTGVGIPAAMLARVFEPFTQVEHATDRAQGGLGIGLALVRGLVRLHDGRVEVRSEGLEQGSEFVVHLPLEAAPSGGGAPPAEPVSAPCPPRRVMVVDDNHDAADSLGLLLALEGAEVRVAYDGPAALEILDAFQPAVVVLDIGMPGMDGLELAQRIRRQPRFRDVALIALTGWGQAEDRRRSRAAGFDYHLTKPVDIDKLRTVLAAFETGSA